MAHIQPHLTELSEPHEVERTAYMLGRLYDLLMCQGLASALVQRLRADAGIPVCDRMASPSHPIAKVANMLGQADSSTNNRRFALQALMLKAIS